MAYHPPGHPFHRLSWFPQDELIAIVGKGKRLEDIKTLWIKNQEEFWERVEHIPRYQATDKDTGETISDTSDPNAFGIPNYAGLPTHMIKLNDLRRLREAGRQITSSSSPCRRLVPPKQA